MADMTSRFQAQSGQSALIGVVGLILLTVALIASANTFMQQSSKNRNVVDTLSIQTYYVANAGIQEAIATRFLPRSNFLSFVNPANPSPYNFLPPMDPRVKSPYPKSGLVFQNVGANPSGLMGVYRYVIVGGDPSRKNDPMGPYYGEHDMTANDATLPRLLTNNSTPWDGVDVTRANSPLYVISKGMTCIANDKAWPNKFVASSSSVTYPTDLRLASNTSAGTSTSPSPKPQCNSGYKPSNLTVVAKVLIEPESNLSKPDQVVYIHSFPEGQPVVLDQSAYIPGEGWKKEITDFEKVWGYQAGETARGDYRTASALTNPARPRKVVFFQMGSHQIYANYDLPPNGSADFTRNQPVPVDAAIMLYFDGPIDYRSLSNDFRVNKLHPSVVPNKYYYNKNLDGCKNTVKDPLTNQPIYNCSIQMTSTVRGLDKPYTGMAVVPNLPYSTKVLLLPPLGYSESPRDYTEYFQLNVYPEKIRGFNYVQGPKVPGNGDSNGNEPPLTIKFKTVSRP